MPVTVNNEQYSAFKTLWKALVAFLSTIAGGELAIYSLPLPDSAADFEVRWPVYVAGCLFALWKAWENIRKQLGLVRYPWEA